MVQISTEWHRCWTDGRRTQGVLVARQTSAAAKRGAWRRAFPCGRGRCKTTSSVYSQIFQNRSSGQQRQQCPSLINSSNKGSAQEQIPQDQVTDLEDKIHQVFAVLVQVTEGEANDTVFNSSGMGLEAWRKLTRRWNPLTRSRLRNLLRHVISPGRASLTELPGALERWEEQVSKYRNSKTSRDGVETYPKTS